MIQHLRAAFEDAIEREIVLINPARAVRVRATNAEKNARSSRDEKALTEEERDRFLQAANGDPCLFWKGGGNSLSPVGHASGYCANSKAPMSFAPPLGRPTTSAPSATVAAAAETATTSAKNARRSD